MTDESMGDRAALSWVKQQAGPPLGLEGELPDYSFARPSAPSTFFDSGATPGLPLMPLNIALGSGLGH